MRNAVVLKFADEAFGSDEIIPVAVKGLAKRHGFGRGDRVTRGGDTVSANDAGTGQ